MSTLNFGGNTGNWDSGRYSESRIIYHASTKLWHTFPTGSPAGATHGGGINKVNEQIGWAVSSDGLTFVEYPHNPVAAVTRAPEIDAAHSLTTPRTEAMAEGTCEDSTTLRSTIYMNKCGRGH